MQVDFSYCQQPVWSSCEANYLENGPKKRGRGRKNFRSGQNPVSKADSLPEEKLPESGEVE
ncbi:hypothetical protein AM592_13415 [Bacillus gobiensis]|uniref:Uncharacterized protein n=1 Tax=Bacillus gobiensis TaxID=1441095 RepID=A0A0M5JBX6_9BACI|nr:hypothetical protein AM592_13415 [Bacillus gobiensis]